MLVLGLASYELVIMKEKWKLPLLLGSVVIVFGAWLWLLETREKTILHSTGADLIGERAATWIQEGFEILWAARPESTTELEFRHDINKTGLIGLSWSEITTSGGNLEAKRTATDPEWGKALVNMMLSLGVRKGDPVAAAFSGSFPGMNLAVIAAARSLELDLQVTASVGASNYGANHPDFTWLDMELALMDAGWPSEYFATAVTMGGGQDTASNLSLEGQSFIRTAIQRRGLPLLKAPTLQAMIRLRLEAIDAAFGTDPKLYINVGGASGSVGYCPEWVEWDYGKIEKVPACPGGTPGVMELMFEKGVPVLHLLNIRGLASQSGIPLDRRF